MKRNINYAAGDSLSYAEYGEPDGYPILIQHGLIASIDDYNLFDRLIRAKARLICAARPGYGESSPHVMESFAEWADIVGPLIQELGLTQFDALAMSSGAPYGYALGWRFPERVQNIYIFSGIPALYDEIVLSSWPYPALRDKSLADLEDLAHRLFFSNLTSDDLRHNDIQDSMRHHGFGVAQDLGLRFRPWGFSLSDVKGTVYMRHSRGDEAVPLKTAERTAELLPHCELEIMETRLHFSKEALDDFLGETVVDRLYPKEA